MKLFRRTLAALLSATMLLSAFPLNAISEDTEAPKTETSDPAEDSTVTSANGFQYSILPDGTAEICGYTGKNAVHLSVPDRIDGHVVTRLAVEAFARNETLQSVVIPATVKKIGNSAFYHCSSLKAIAFEGIGVEFGFTVAEGAISLKKVFCLDSHDLSGFCALLVTDMGQDVASGIEISAYADLPSLRNAYNAYVKPVSMQLGRPLLGAVTVSGDPIAEGTLGEDIVWVLESNGTLSVTGNGPMPDFSSQSSPWYTHRESILRVTLSDGITRVGACAFQNCNKIKTLSLPEGLTGIGSNAFYNCSSLQSLTLPSSLEGIDAQAFYNCDGITGGLTVPASVTYIKDSAFYDCNGFNGKLVIEENSGMTIGYRAFYNCQGFTSLELGTGVTSIGEAAFYYCCGMKGNLVIPDSVTAIYANAFYNCYGFDGTLTLSRNLTVIPRYAFAYCQGLKGELVIPDGVTSIEYDAFYQDNGITSVVLGTGITSVYTPFSGMSNIRKITFKGSAAPSGNPFSGVDLTLLESVYVPAEGYSSYAEAYQSYLGNSWLRATGAESDFVTKDSVLVAYCGTDEEVVIPDGITAIGPGAFRGNPSVVQVTLPDSVEEIRSFAFYGCEELTNVNLSENLVSIGSSAFGACVNLKSVELPDGLESIDGYAFSGCTSIRYLTLSSSLVSIGASAFYNCTSIRALTLPDSLITIGDYAFYNCDSAAGGLTVPASVTYIGQYAFYDCDGLNGKLVIRENEGMTIGNYAFYGCENLTGLEIGNGVTVIGNQAFAECRKISGDLVIPNSVTSIGNRAFFNCNGFDGSLILSENLTTIENYTFYGCGNISGELVIPDKVISITSYAFSYMSRISSVTVGKGVTSVSYPFTGCVGIRQITLKGKTVPSGNPFYEIQCSPAMVYVPAESYDAYAAAYKTSLPVGTRLGVFDAEGDFLLDGDTLQAYLGNDSEVVIPDGIKAIGVGAFKNCETLAKVTMPDSVEIIGEYAFSGCTALATVAFSENIKAIGNAAFYGCTAIKYVTFPESLISIGDSAFYGCSALRSLTFPTRLETIGASAFYNCDRITGGLTIPASVSVIGNNAFYDCDGFEGALIIEESDGMTIGDYAFYHCGGFTELDLGYGVTAIGNSAFRDCVALSGDLVIPDSVTSVKNYAFSGCIGFDGRLTLSANLTQISSYTFYSCNRIVGELVIPDSVTAMNSYAFSYMSDITSVVIGTGLRSVSDPFVGCAGIQEITFNSTSIPTGNVFYNVTAAIKTVYVPAESYEAYVAAYKNSIPAGTQFRVIGAEGDFLIDDGVLKAYLGDGGDVVIPAGVEIIGASAFQNCATLTKVTFPEGLREIREYAFANCTDLVEIVLRDGLTKIGNNAFQNCEELTVLNLPDTLVSIGDYAFYRCKSLTVLNLPDTLVSIGNYAFYECTSIHSINPIVTSSDHMYRCYNVGSITWEDAKRRCEAMGGYLATVTSQEEQDLVQSIVSNGGYAAWLGGYYEDGAWHWLSGEEFSYTNWDEGTPSNPQSEPYLGIYANDTESTYATTGKWNDCSGNSYTLRLFACEWDHTKENILPSSLETIGNSAFYGCTGLSGSLTVPSSVKSIGSNAFYNCYGFFGELRIEDGGEAAIGSSAFRYCNGFSGLALGDGIKSIGSYAFSGCSGMKGDLIIPDSVTSIGSYAFSGCSGFDGRLVLSESLTSIPYQAFANCSGIQGELVIPNGVTVVYYQAFYNMSGITSVVIGENVTRFAYSGSSDNYSYVTFPSSVKKMTFLGDTAPTGNPFYGMNSTLEAVFVPSDRYEVYASVYKTYLPVGARLTIEGAVGDYLIDDDILLAYLGNGGEITIPDGIRYIGVGAFQNCVTLTKVTMPDSVVAINERAFNGCTGLLSVVFSDNLVTIGQYAFRGCGALKEIALPESLITIDNYAFADCASISSLILPSSLDLIGQYAFQNCRGIKGGLTIPASVTVIGHYAFNECRGFDGKLTIRESGGMIIGNCAFRNCVGFTSLEIGYGVTDIGSEAFAYCAGFKGNLVIPNSVTTMGNSAFSGCSGFDGTLTLSESLTQISYGVFYNCSRIKGELFIPDQVTAVYYYAFLGMNSITSVVVGKSVTRFLYSSSTNNTSYNTFPTTVNRITFKGSKIPSGNPLYGMGTALETVYVPASNLEAYINAYRNYLPVNARFEVSDGEREFLIDGDELIAYLGFGGEVTIPDGIRVIGPAAFQNCATLTKITMPDSVTTVSASAFAGCRGLVSVVFSEQLVSIKEKAFMNCVSLASPDLPDSLETIGPNAFSECTAIKALILPPNLKTIGQQAFYNCRGIKGSLTIPSSVTTIGHSAFQGCSGFDGMLVIEETDDLIIGNNAFYSCSGFTGLELGYGVREIGQYAFYRCTGMTGDLAIPNSVSSIGSYAFYQCNGFDGTLTLSENLSVISSYAFSNCTKITGELVIPDKVTEIQDRAFQNLLSLTSIVIGTGVTSVYLPFIDCRAVQEISFVGTRIPTGNPFNAVDGALRYVYVPMEKYDRFVEAYSGFVGANVQFVTDLMKARVKNLAVSHLYSQTVVLTWAPHVCEDVIGYVVKRDGITVADVTTLSFADRNLETGTEYVYTVYGYTADGRTTAENTVTVSPTAPTIRDIKTDNAYNKVGLSNGTIYIYVRNNKNLKPYGDVETVGKLFYLDGEHRILIGQAAMVPTMSSSETAVYAVEWDITDIEDGEYSVLFVLEDVDGGTAEYRENLTVDRSVPDPIINVYAVSDVNVIYVNWAIATEIDTIYRIYRRDSDSEEFELIAQITDRNTLSYVDKKVESDKIYYYYVVGVNDFGQEGEPSSIAAATLTPDTEAPLITLLQPTNESYLTGTVTVGLTSQDNLAVVRSELYYSTDNGETWILLTESNLGVFTWRFDTTALPDGKIKLKGVAYDAAENPSEPLIYVFCIDNTGPEQIQGLEATSTSVTVTLSWEDVTDEDIRFFRVEIKNGDGTYTQVTDVYRTLGVNLMQLSPDTSYTYRVVGYDIHGNRGTPSDDITVRTESDTNPPVVTKIRPTSGHFADKIPVSVTAADEYNVYKIEIQVSSDRDSWTTVYTQTNHSIAKTRSVSFDLALNPYEEGYIYVRAIATDSAGNQSVSDVSAPFVQHVIDRTAPDRPENVTATGYNGYIELRWDQGSETDLGYYSVYRSNQENGTYVLIAANVSALNYFDRNVTAGMTYYYKVTVTDLSGNSSVFSGSVNASVAVDAEKPVIHSVYPSVDNMIGVGLKTVSVLVSDNNELSFILIEYSVNGSAFSTLKLFESINSYNKTVSADLDTSVLTDGDRVSVRVTVQDMSGNQTVSDPVTYTVDLSAPAVPSVTSVFNGSCVEIQWSGLDEEDLAGYRIYRKVLGSSSFNLIAQKQAVAGQTVYSLSDVSLDKVAVTYVYQIAAIDKWGNVSYAETRIELGDRSFPVGVISCESVFEIGVEYVVDASLSTDNSHIVSYLIDFGDGVTTADRKAIHKYTAIGTYTITLTVTDDSGNVTVTTKEVTVKERTLIGSVRIRVIDENGKAVPGASVYFDLGEDTQVIKQTDHQGYASFTADVGKHAVGCIIPNNEWLPAKKEVVVTAGNVTTVTMTMVHHTLVEGHFEIHRMTFEEIIAAGIDVSNPENQHYVKVMVHLVYEATTVSTPIYVNPITHEQKSSPIVVDERVYYPQVVYPNGGGGGGGLGGGYHFSYEPTVILFELPVEVSCLKEFFDVKLHIINNASDEFSMLDNVITLNVPDGLTLMDTNVSSGSSVVKISEIKGQTTETIRWILRGDEVGEYYLTADYSGILSQFNAPITTRFVAEDPIEVYGLSNLKLLVEVAETLDHGTLYYNCALINEGWLDVYLPGIDTPDELIEIELLDDRGRRLLESMGLTAKDFIAKDDQGITIEEWVTTLSGDPGVLKPGYALRKHYMCINQSSYTEKEYKLKDYWYEIQNSYGLEVEIVVKPLAYFKGYLNSEVNPVEKAENVLGIHKNLYDYLMDSQNFTYWAFYSSNGALNSELPSKAETMIWEMMKLDFVEMITDEESEELIKALILDTMELTLETTSDYSTYLNAANFLKKVTDFAEKAKLDELLGEGFEFIGKHIPRCFDFMFTYSKWEFYQSVTAMYGDSERFFYYQWSQYVKVESLEISISETEFSKIIHKIFSAEGFEAVWEGLCKAPDVIKDVVKICKNVEMDIALFIAAQSNIDNCNLFLDAVIACAPASQAVHNSMLEYVGEAFLIAAVPWAGIPAQIINQTYIQVVYGDADKVVRCAKEIKENINNGSVLRSLLDNLLEDQLDTFVDEVIGQSVKAAAKFAGLVGSGWVTALKVGLKLVTFIGDNVFNVSERHDIADNIRYISILTLAMQTAIHQAETTYREDPSSVTSQKFMQLLYYLINIRQIGESQVAELGVSYEVLPVKFPEGYHNPWNSEDLFKQVCSVSHVSGVDSWYEWRDVVEDELSLLRVDLFRNPVTTEVTGLKAPVVTFDYARGETVQTFSDEYQYSVDGGTTWHPCDGNAIKINPGSAVTTLMVQRVDRTNTDQTGTGYCTVYGIPSLMSSGIVAVENAFGYLIDHLDNRKQYEITFSKTPLEYEYGDSLSMRIPAGSYSFLYHTDEDYDYVYIRALSDANSYASYTLESAIVKYESTWDVNTEDRKITNLTSTSKDEFLDYCDKLGSHVTVTDPSGETGDSIGTGHQLSVDDQIYDIVVSADVNGDAVIDMSDLELMLAHMNGIEELAGLLLEAGCLSGGEDIDIFDVFEALELVLANQATE